MNKLNTGDTFAFTLHGASQAQINAFGALLGTNGKIHTDPQWAANSPLRGVIVQGGLLMAPLHQIMSQLVGPQTWFESGELEVKIVSFTRPEEAVRLEITVDEASATGASFSLSWSKDGNATVLAGKASAGAKH